MLTIDRLALVNALRLHGRVISRKAVKPILQNVKLHVLPAIQELVVQSTDLEKSLTTYTPCQGTTCDQVVPLKSLLAVLTKSTGSRVSIGAPGDIGSRKCEIGTDQGTVTLVGDDSEEFPVIHEWATSTDTYTFDCTAGMLREGIEKTAFAAAKERSRFAFNGVRLQTDESCFRMIATDGKRMAVYSTNGRDHREPSLGHIVPTASLEVLAKCLPVDGASLIYMRATEREVIFTNPGVFVLSSRLVDGAFPKYESVVPRTAVATVTCDRSSLLSALQFAKLMTNEEARSIRMILSPEGLHVTGKAMDVGEVRSAFKGTFTGQPMEVAYNPDFLIEGAQSFEQPEVTFAIAGADIPARMDAAGASHVYVIMPVTLRKA